MMIMIAVLAFAEDNNKILINFLFVQLCMGHTYFWRYGLYCGYYPKAQ